VNTVKRQFNHGWTRMNTDLEKAECGNTGMRKRGVGRTTETRRKNEKEELVNRKAQRSHRKRLGFEQVSEGAKQDFAFDSFGAVAQLWIIRRHKLQ
jgi:hypothetical protein